MATIRYYSTYDGAVIQDQELGFEFSDYDGAVIKEFPVVAAGGVAPSFLPLLGAG